MVRAGLWIRGAVTAAFIIDHDIDVIIIKVMETGTFLLVASKGRRGCVDVRILGEGPVGTVCSMVFI